MKTFFRPRPGSHLALPVSIALLSLALALTGCGTRSISDSGYRHPYGYDRASNPLYTGELTELDILGTAPKTETTHDNIQKALTGNLAPAIKRGDRMLLIQSGAMIPDHAMVETAARYFDVAPFNGVPPKIKEGLADSLRLRAAQGGYPFVLCYWGVLESAIEDREGRAVSWVPIAGMFVPDQKQKMRLRLKALLVDVATGGWRMLAPDAPVDTHLSSRWSRQSTDQQLVESLKTEGYRRLISELLKYESRGAITSAP